ncbi:MAG: ATP-dependent Clp protease adaptor ClpS [Methylophagaceae bacterium]|jgi:ATP-dependent Clp protease adaptor protein ClpS|tara:strand:+ start:444 stop:755 length:312 start_codon:yes stop_codon:yes gene_type:complete
MSEDVILDVKIDEKLKQTITEPPKFKVVFLNDDTTPVEWVISILVQVFRHTNDSAEKITLSIHTDGSGVAGIYTYEIAEQKALEAQDLSRSQGFPLQIKIEKE